MPKPLASIFSESTLAALALLGAMILWSSSFVVLKIVLAVYHPLIMAAGRMAVSVVVIILLWKWLHPPMPSRRDCTIMIFLALCEPCFYFVFEGYAMKYTTASQAGMVVSALPVLVITLSWIFLRERLHWQTAFGFALALVGVIWLSWDATATESAPNPPLGNMLEGIAMLCASAYVIAAKKLSTTCSPLTITTMQSVVGLVFFMPLLALPEVDIPTEFHLLPVLGIIYLGAAITLGSFLLYNYAIARVPAAQTGTFLNLIPIITLFMGMFFLDERLSIEQWCASAVVLAGVLIGQRGNYAPQKSDTTRHCA